MGFRPNDVFAETDVAVMHGYPMYADWARGPLDPDFVPFLCALTTALCGKPTLMEEFGGCTEAPGRPSSVWRWRPYGQARDQFMASEEDLAAYLEMVLPRLVEVGALGAMIWCFADYAPELHGRPPCDENRHERFFGLVRPDGSVKPHAEVLAPLCRHRAHRAAAGAARRPGRQPGGLLRRSPGPRSPALRGVPRLRLARPAVPHMREPLRRAVPVEGFCLSVWSKMVDLRGFEPLTSAMRMPRSPE